MIIINGQANILKKQFKQMDNWKSLHIYYISGTGNAKASSEWIADEAEKRGLNTVVQQIDRLENIKMPSAYDNPLIGFAFPTHGFNAAPIMLKFIAGFPHEAWWWKIVSGIIGIGGMILIATQLYRIMHYAMGLKPVRYLVRFTSLTAFPFWRRYKFIRNRKTHKDFV